MMPVSAETMRELDRMAEISGISALSLMENAGEAISEKACELLRSLKGTRVVIFCGKGNNGGDGFVAGRKLAERGFDVRVYLMGKARDVRNEAAAKFRSLMEADVGLDEISSETDIEQLKNKLGCSLIIDALLGTGFSGSVSGPLKKLIELLNSSGIPILAVDVPSGLNSTTGGVNPVGIKARWTISFALPKKGFYEKGGPEHTGELVVTNIGFSEKLLKKAVEFEQRLCAISQ